MKISLFFVRIRKLVQTLISLTFIRALFCNHTLPGTEHKPILIKGFATFIDIGANKGQFALAARKWSRQPSIYSFEPLSDASNTFKKLFQKDKKTYLFQTAITTKAGETNIHVTAADDSSSLLPISPLQEQLFPGTGEVRTEKVRTGPLSDFIRADQIHSPALLKIDVQGYELETLRGCASLLHRFDSVYVECSFVELYVGQPLAGEVIEWLNRKGWSLTGVYNMTYDNRGNSIQADFLFGKVGG